MTATTDIACDSLAATGYGDGVVVIAVVAVLLMALGVMFLIRARRRTAAGVVVVVLTLVALAGVVGTAHPERADALTFDCVSVGDSLSIAQTSLLSGLRPGGMPQEIEGTVTYHGNDTTSVNWIQVSITAVTKAFDAAAGACDSSDYTLGKPVMAVAHSLEPGEPVPFGGATIEFNDKDSNQNACQGATVHLRYEAVV